MYFKFKKVKNKAAYINPFHIFAAHLLKTRSKAVLSIRESYKMQSKVVLSNRESFKMQLWQVAVIKWLLPNQDGLAKN